MKRRGRSGWGALASSEGGAGAKALRGSPSRRASGASAPSEGRGSAPMMKTSSRLRAITPETGGRRASIPPQP